MNKCKYAFDKSEPDCAGCDGIAFDVDGVIYQSIECGGFEPETNIQEVEEATNTETSENQATTTQKQVANTSLQKEEKVTTQAEKTVVEATSNEYVSTAKVKSIMYSSSVTVKHNENYYKFTAQEEWELQEGCDVNLEREALWKKLNDEVDKQVLDLR